MEDVFPLAASSVQEAPGLGSKSEHAPHAQRVWFALGTHHISCLFIKKMVRRTGCAELGRPQGKNTFMCHDWGCSRTHRMHWSDLVRTDVSSIQRPKNTASVFTWWCVPPSTLHTWCRSAARTRGSSRFNYQTHSGSRVWCECGVLWGLKGF